MDETLIVTANASIAKIFSSTLTGNDELTEIGQLEHPESRMKGRELNSDASGDFHPPKATMGVHVGHNDPKEDEWHNFAKQVVTYIKQHQQPYKQIIICATPRFEGLLNKHWDKQISAKICKHITKDYTALTNKELYQVIKESIKKRLV